MRGTEPLTKTEAAANPRALTVTVLPDRGAPKATRAMAVTAALREARDRRADTVRADIHRVRTHPAAATAAGEALARLASEASADITADTDIIRKMKLQSGAATMCPPVLRVRIIMWQAEITARR